MNMLISIPKIQYLWKLMKLYRELFCEWDNLYTAYKKTNNNYYDIIVVL